MLNVERKIWMPITKVAQNSQATLSASAHAVPAANIAAKQRYCRRHDDKMHVMANPAYKEDAKASTREVWCIQLPKYTYVVSAKKVQSKVRDSGHLRALFCGYRVLQKYRLTSKESDRCS
jgi:hypothetical protein